MWVGVLGGVPQMTDLKLMIQETENRMHEEVSGGDGLRLGPCDKPFPDALVLLCGVRGSWAACASGGRAA